MGGLEQYRMSGRNDYEWVDRYTNELGYESFHEYLDRVRKALDALAPGHYYDITRSVPEDRRELFVKACCSYAYGHYPYYEFNDDYTQIWNIRDKYEEHEQRKLESERRKLRSPKHRKNAAE